MKIIGFIPTYHFVLWERREKRKRWRGSKGGRQRGGEEIGWAGEREGEEGEGMEGRRDGGRETEYEYKKGRELRHDLSSPRSANAGSQPQALIPSSILIPPRFCVEHIWKEKSS